MEFVKISRTEFLNTLNSKNVALLEGGFYPLDLQATIDILKTNIGGLYLRTPLHVGILKKRSNGFTRGDSHYNFCKGCQIYHDNKQLYLLFTENENEYNSIVLLRCEN